ncbi:MAG: GLPGLI family protein [Bacteroidota bacterium]|nr:GLPGLI family protein [Bacteroidota bacterium]
MVRTSVVSAEVFLLFTNMKKYSILCLFLMFGYFSLAQKYYNILYETRWETEYGKSRPVYKSRLLIKDSLAYEYVFNGNDIGKQPYGKRFMGHSTYFNLSSGLMLFQTQPWDNRKFLIEDTIQKFHWEIANEEKTILNHICKKATGIINGNKYIAWFAPSIPISVGPNRYGGLPGIILQLILVKDQQVSTIIEINNQPFEIVQPAVGNKMTAQQFEKLKR